jgi:hypothetical protein
LARRQVHPGCPGVPQIRRLSLTFATHPQSRRPPFPHVQRGVTAALVVVVPIAALLDGWREPLPGFLPAVTWLDLAAAGCLAWAVLQPGAWRDRARWSTPFDGLVLAMLALSTVGALHGGPGGPRMLVLQQAVACSGAFFGLSFVLRRTPGASEFVWRALAVTAALIGAHALWAATGGLSVLTAQAQHVDLRWAGRHGLAGMLAFATLATAGRAAEHRASSPWRLAFVVGAVGLAVHVAVGGLAVHRLSLARLDDPMDFSAACVTWLIAWALARGAGALRKERRAEAWRWRALACATAGLGAASVFGDGSGGEGVRALAVLAAVGILGSPAEAGATREETGEDEAPLARAA